MPPMYSARLRSIVVAHAFQASADREWPPATISSGPSGRTRLAYPRRSASPQTVSGFSGQKKIGSQPSASSAVSSTLRSPSRGEVDRDMVAHGMRRQLQRFAQARALIGRHRQVIRLAVVAAGFRGARHPADLDDLARAQQGSVIHHAVETLDHLRARCAEPEHRAAVGQLVQAGRRLRQQRRCARVDRENTRAKLCMGACREIAQACGGVEAVGLADPELLEPGLFEPDGALGDLEKTVAIA